MAKTRHSFQISAIFMVLAMVATLFPMSAMAYTDHIISSGIGSDVAGITVSGADICSCAPAKPFASNDGNASNMTYTFKVLLSSSTSDTAALTATLAKASGSGCTISSVPRISNGPTPTIPAALANQSLTYSATLSGGSGTATAYVYPNLTGDFTRFDTYVFNYSKSTLNNPQSTPSGSMTFRFGDPAYPNTAPECYMSFSTATAIGQDVTAAYLADYAGPQSGYYPNTLAFYIPTNAGKITSMTGTNVNFVEYDSDGNITSNASSPSSGTTLHAGFYVLSIADNVASRYITITNSTEKFEIQFNDPSNPTTPSGSAPTSVVSYLPIGQYATGSDWGGSAGKFTGGYESTGVSLGALGGYIEFYYENGITDDSKNPYGVDFVVYGNAFNGNPEAGAVQVSEDGTTWYELAGSLYYDDNFNFVGNQGSAGKFSKAYTGTLRDTNVNYTLGKKDIQATLGGHGPNTFTTATAWWPATDKYSLASTSAAHTDSNVTISRTSSALSFGGVTAVQDYDTNASYAFGYADVTPNGSPATYGDAVNPYTTYTSSKTGGDGFDLEWAVNIATGKPVNVTGKTFHYVRVYSAVLDNGTFGETSPEVCGIFTTANQATSSVGTTAAPSITINGDNISEYGPIITSVGNVIVYDIGGLNSGMTVAATGAAGDNVYVNSSASSSYTTGAQTTAVRVVAQNGTAAPYIAIIK